MLLKFLNFFFNFGYVKSINFFLIESFNFLFLSSFLLGKFSNLLPQWLQQNFDGIKEHNSMLLDILEKCFLILIIDVILNSLTQCNSQEFACYVDWIYKSNKCPFQSL